MKRGKYIFVSEIRFHFYDVLNSNLGFLCFLVGRSSAILINPSRLDLRPIPGYFPKPCRSSPLGRYRAAAAILSIHFPLPARNGFPDRHKNFAKPTTSPSLSFSLMMPLLLVPQGFSRFRSLKNRLAPSNIENR